MGGRMSLEDYSKAYKLGKKEYQYRMMHGMNPMLEVLDDILPTRGSFSEIPLGLVQIPVSYKHLDVYKRQISRRIDWS